MKQNNRAKFFALILISAVLILASCQQSASGNPPANKNRVVCTQDVKQCPGGSYVGRTGPNCEFAACPAGNSAGSSGVAAGVGISANATATIPGSAGSFTMPAASGLYNYTDLPLDSFPDTPISTKFLVEHRFALNKKVVSVKGIIVAALLGKDACPSASGTGVPSMMLCAQPRITVADTLDDKRDKNYDIIIFVNEDDTNYKAGQNAEVKGTVESSKTAVYITKIY